MSSDGLKFWTMVQPGANPDEATLRAHPGVYEVSAPSMLALGAVETLKNVLGFGQSLGTDKNMLADGEPIPLMSYAFIEYAMGLDHSDLRVLEIGGGQSTLFWCKRAKSVVTLEHHQDWLEHIRRDAPANLTVKAVDQDHYPAEIERVDSEFDIIIVDAAANRFQCARAAIGKLGSGGMVVLDNSDWYPNTAAFLRERDLIQVDFADFRGDRHYRCCTSIFLHPEFRAKPVSARLPRPVLGGKDAGAANLWDRAEG